AEQLLKEAQAQMRALEKQIGDLSKAKAEAEAAAKQQAPSIVTDAAAAAASVASGATGVSAAGGLRVGATAWVQNEQGQNLRRRAAPGLEAKILDGLPVGTQLELLEGPVSDDGYTWWRIRTKDGREGWVAGEGLVTR
ncbi:MAG: SH3 domain-containing protein, partial [Chloroflexota bacterium]